MRENKPQAEIIREKLRAGFAVKTSPKHDGNALLNIAEQAVPGLDPYISGNIDKYLYEK